MHLSWIYNVFILHFYTKYVILDIQKRTTAHKGLTYNEIALPPITSQSIRVAFAMYNYLQNVKTNVSNARRKRPFADIISNYACYNRNLKCCNTKNHQRQPLVVLVLPDTA